MRPWATLAVLVVTVAISRPGLAGNGAAEREARHNFQAGEAHFKAGLYAEALADYQAGYAAAPLPGFLINVAQCQRRLGDLARARATYQKFLLVAPDSPLVPEVKRLIADLDQMLAEEAAANKEAPGDTKEESALIVVPAAPVPVQPTTTATVMLTAQPAPLPDRPLWKRWWVWGMVGAAIVAGTATAFALSSPGATTLHDGSLGSLRR
jgi:hypothetical protein